MADDYVFGAHDADPELVRLRMIEDRLGDRLEDASARGSVMQPTHVP